MCGGHYYPEPTLDAARPAATREEVENLAAGMREEDWIVVFDLETPSSADIRRGCERYRFPTNRYAILPWTVCT